MRSNQDIAAKGTFQAAAGAARPLGDAAAQRSCYGIQVLVAGRRKQWRDEIGAQVRRAGFNATTVDSAVDALTVLVLGLPVDVLVTDADLRGSLCCSRLAEEARALRPNLGIVFSGDSAAFDGFDAVPPHVVALPVGGDETALARSVREALAARTN
ncbi:histidine kinase [Methylorubrum salsuginis]|uniref:Uncharacterized protein n=1 Tax=Methylorubrum salsuginis TaxID=414703 RepID=A0A1I4KEE3_9HYPH|nr:histidine kinase [Methylorubrum salsuginis]SFL77098.1 hypothetical protein SAMN04488125_12416 [Methylorubrum salsuginis]